MCQKEDGVGCAICPEVKLKSALRYYYTCTVVGTCGKKIAQFSPIRKRFKLSNYGGKKTLLGGEKEKNLSIAVMDRTSGMKSGSKIGPRPD